MPRENSLPARTTPLCGTFTRGRSMIQTPECVAAASIGTHGYGQVWDGRRMARAYRVAWEKANGPIPDGLCVLHHCDNPACINVEHLFLGTHADNMQDKAKKGRARTSDRRGEANTAATLTREEVRTIRALWASGETRQSEIAQRFGVCQQHVSRIVRGALWSVPNPDE